MALHHYHYLCPQCGAVEDRPVQLEVDIHSRPRCGYCGTFTVRDDPPRTRHNLVLVQEDPLTWDEAYDLWLERELRELMTEESDEIAT